MVGITRGWSILNTLIFGGVKLVSYYIMFNFEEFLYHIIELIYMYLWVIIVIMFEVLLTFSHLYWFDINLAFHFEKLQFYI